MLVCLLSDYKDTKMLNTCSGVMSAPLFSVLGGLLQGMEIFDGEIINKGMRLVYSY